MTPSHPCRLLLIFGLCAPFFVASPAAAQEEPEAGSATTVAATADPESDERIRQLIGDLGDPQFAVRERAQNQLKTLGLVAFDALNEALESDDLEIALRAEYLLRSMSVEWYSANDPPLMKQLLTDYGIQTEKDRQSRIESLAKMTEGDVLRALCRLARFETSARLSKTAALHAMKLKPENPDRSAAAIMRLLGPSKRPGAAWLRIFSRQLTDGNSVLSEWNDVIRKERRVLVSAATRTSLTLVRDLSRWHVSQLKQAGQEEEALAAMRRSLELIDGSKDQVKENALWLLKEKAWPLLTELAEQHQIYFDNLVDFRYLLAEAAQGAGKDEEANRLAREALELKPEEHEEHIEAAVQLTERGLFEWAANEFKTRIEENDLDSLPNLRSRFLYSEMLHDGQLNPLEAVKVLEPMVEALENDNVSQQVRLSLGRNPTYVKARMHYFKALGHMELAKEKPAAERKADQDVAREALDQAVALYGDNDPDILIAMYRLEGQDDAWRRQLLQRIIAASARMKKEITQFESLVKRQQQLGPNLARFERQLASLNNQYAWLVANTEGDYSSALAASKKSLEYTPGSPVYLDTLARCYFANRDYANAVKHQRMAVEQMAHSGLMLRQLKEFEAALKRQRGE